MRRETWEKLGYCYQNTSDYYTETLQDLAEPEDLQNMEYVPAGAAPTIKDEYWPGGPAEVWQRIPEAWMGRGEWKATSVLRRRPRAAVDKAPPPPVEVEEESEGDRMMRFFFPTLKHS